MARARGRAAELPEPERPVGGFRPWHYFTLASLMAATAAVVMSHGARPEHLILLSLTVGAAGAAGLGVYRTVAPLLAEPADTAREPVGERTRAGLEREKMLALRAIKELEFDRAMRKVSARDYEEMVARLRARAVALMKQLDQTDAGYQELIERELLARLGPRPIQPQARAAGTPASGDARLPLCPACGTTNDADARFCKGCGARLESPAPPAGSS